MRDEFIEAVEKNQPEFGLSIPDSKIELLADYYETVIESNDLLHLVAPSSVDEFVIRHILESLAILEFLPQNARFADIGPGAGLPSIPCLIVRDDLESVLIESKLKKASFLERVVEKLGLESRVHILNNQFEEVEFPETSYVTCRALDKFTKKLPKIIKWAGKATLLLFGGNSMREALEMSGVNFDERLIQMSEQRFLFISKS
jgi:16S rRNA (guanine527-N7)-methyltransferase